MLYASLRSADKGPLATISVVSAATQSRMQLTEEIDEKMNNAKSSVELRIFGQSLGQFWCSPRSWVVSRPANSSVSVTLLGSLDHVMAAQGSLEMVLSMAGGPARAEPAKWVFKAIANQPELLLLQEHGPEKGRPRKEGDVKQKRLNMS
eukprot:Skav219778  [mRNA]  locus=scaffold431:16950:19262:- [translate_table: standard]